MKVRVSRHVACTWSWGISVTLSEDDPKFSLTLRKCHPLWELATEAISHLPGWLPTWVTETAAYAALEEKYSASVAELEISDFMAKSLYPPIWQIGHAGDDDE